MSSTLYLDETKQHGLLLVAVRVPASQVSRTRRALRDLLAPGQRRIHMRSERAARKMDILRTVNHLGLSATVYDGSGYPTHKSARSACITRVVEDAVLTDVRHLVFEVDTTLLRADRRDLLVATRRLSAGHLQYQHLPAVQEPLLWLPDALAWAVAKGGSWRELASQTVIRRVRV